MSADRDTIDLGEVAREVARGWRRVIAGVLVGLAVAAAVLLFAPPQFKGAASVVVRTTSDAASSLFDKLGASGDPSFMGVPSPGQRPLETEIQVLHSRALAGAVVDSLGLQVEPVTPTNVPAHALVRYAQIPGSFEPRTYAFTRDGSGYRYHGPGTDAGRAEPGAAFTIAGGRATLASGRLPDRFTVRVLDRDDAIAHTLKRLGISKAGGDVVSIEYRAGDSLTAAAAPNTLVSAYLERRRTTDRGTNQRRAEFLTEQAASVSRQLADAERRLRRAQEGSGVLDPALSGKTAVEEAASLRAELGSTEVEQGALNQLRDQLAAGKITPRQLGAYPTFLRSEAINAVLTQLSEQETQRIKLLERRTEKEPDVAALGLTIQNLERQLPMLASTYATALARRHEVVSRQLGAVNARLAALPGQAEQNHRLVLDVERLARTYTGLEGQLVQARLAAIGEGGDVRALDLAAVPREPWFPRPALTIVLGVLLGLLLGIVAALQAAYLGRWVRDPQDVERTVGISAVAFDPQVPLLLGGLNGHRTVLVVPVGADSDPAVVAQRLAETAAARRGSVRLATGLGAADGDGESQVRQAIESFERDDGLSVVPLPRVDDPRTAALLDPHRPVVLVGRAGRLERRKLQRTVEMLRRLDVPCAGVVLQRDGGDASRRS